MVPMIPRMRGLVLFSTDVSHFAHCIQSYCIVSFSNPTDSVRCVQMTLEDLTDLLPHWCGFSRFVTS